MAALETTNSVQGFRVGAVLARSLGLMRLHLGKFVLLAAIAQVPLVFSSHHASMLALLLNDVQFLRSGGNTVTAGQQHYIFGWMEYLSWLLIAISHPAIIFGAFQSMRGQDFKLGESLRRGLQRFLPVIGVVILMYGAYFIGMVLLLVPGLILRTMFLVAVPACVVERLGPIASLGRSASLTKGARWRLFGLFILVTVAAGLVVTPIQLFILSTAGALAAALSGAILGALVGAFELVVFAVAYYDLRVVKEGIDIEQLAAVFD